MGLDESDNHGDQFLVGCRRSLLRGMFRYRFLVSLSVYDHRAVEQRFGLQDGRKRSYREVGEELGVTAEAARRLVKRAVNIVRESAPDQMDIDAA